MLLARAAVDAPLIIVVNTGSGTVVYGISCSNCIDESTSPAFVTSTIA